MDDSQTGQTDQRAAAPVDVYIRARGLWKKGEWRAAVDLLEQLVDSPEVDEAFAERASRKLLSYLSRLDSEDGVAAARRTIERFPVRAFGYRYLGEILLQKGQAEAALDPLRRAIELDPLDQDARQLLVIARRGPPAEKRPAPRSRVWPARQSHFNSPNWAVRRWVLSGYPIRPLVRADTVFMTLGSCFATNLGERLQAAGYSVHSEPIGEEINSTYANRYLLDWVEHGPSNGPTRRIDEVFGPEGRARLQSALKASRVLILTLGVAPCFFEVDTGEFAFATLGTRSAREYIEQRCRMRTTTVEENVANLEAVLDTAHRLAGHELQVVLTVSPVPLAGTAEHYSAVLADCLSKSTLRLACEQVLQTRPGAIYWPSFEIVRWLGAHYSPGVAPVFGADDGNSRHVSTWLVDMIVDLFVSYNSATAPVPTASASSHEVDAAPAA